MTEQNAHDDERDTADLATNDAADLAAGDATDLVTDDTADLAIDDTSDSAVDDTSDLAAGDAADLATADTARPQTAAEQLTPAGRAVSPSPSPTPTFAATDRPARRARRLRWKPGITRPMMALSAASFALMVAGVGGYVSAIPGRGCRRQAQHGGDPAGIGAVARRPDARGPGRSRELDARSGSLDGRRVEDRRRRARCRGRFGPWLELRHAGRCVADRGICGFLRGFVVHPCSADRRWRLGCIGV